MKLLAWILPIFLCALSAMSTPLYRAGQPKTSTATQWLHGEISAGYAFSNVSLQDYLGQSSSGNLHGWNARALWTPLPWLSAGVEYVRYADKSLTPALVEHYRQSRVGAVVKFTLSPDTNPRVYLLGGYGRGVHHIDFTSAGSAYRKQQNYWMAGLGTEVSVYKAVFVAAEGSVYVYPSAKIALHYKLSSRVQTALGLRAGVRF